MLTYQMELFLWTRYTHLRKLPRTLQIPFLNVATNYESIPRGSFLGTFEPMDEEINEVHTTSWKNLDRQVQQAHAQL